VKLRTRFALFSIFLTAIIVFGTGYSSLHFLKSLVLKEIESNQVTIVENLKKVCEESQVSRDDIFAYNYVTSLQKTVPGIAYAVFVDTRRELILGDNEPFMQVMVSTDNILKNKKNPKPQERYTLADGKRILSYAAGVHLPQGRVGTVFLGFFEEKVEENVRRSILQITTILHLLSLFYPIFSGKQSFWELKSERPSEPRY